MKNRSIDLIRTASWMYKNLITCSSDHMTPEIKLRLLTPACPLWTSQPEQCPYKDPYWAFYWPGGQALTRFIFDNPQIVRGKSILDFGTGCGATAIAARLCGAKVVVANDIDPIALLATALNGKLNGLKAADIRYEAEDLLDRNDDSNWDVITVGDMCYDSEFSEKLLSWLKKQRGEGRSGEKTSVIVGDPGRHGLANASRIVKLNLLARYSLPDHMTREHYGLSVANIYSLE